MPARPTSCDRAGRFGQLARGGSTYIFWGLGGVRTRKCTLCPVHKNKDGISPRLRGKLRLHCVIAAAARKTPRSSVILVAGENSRIDEGRSHAGERRLFRRLWDGTIENTFH